MNTNYRLMLLRGACIGILNAIAVLIYGQTEWVEPAYPVIPNTIFNIKDFGALSDTLTDNTLAIQNAINAAGNAGGGIVVVPAGVYLCGPVKFVSNLNLRIDSGAIVKLLPLGRYPGGTVEGTNFISGSKLHDIAITGKGVIDGQGSAWWPFAKTEGAKRPRLISLRDCDKILLEDIKLMNSPMFHIAIGGKTTNVNIRRLIIRAPASDDPVNPSHNTDACNVTGTNVWIRDCDVSVGDDNFTCGGGTSNVRISNCIYGNGHGVSIGSPTHGGISNITVENCTFNNTECGIRIKSDRDRGGVLQNLTYRNLQMTNVRIPILVYAAYNAKEREYRLLHRLTPEIAATYPAAEITEYTPVYRNITFQNITATAQKGRRAGLIWGLPESAISDVILQNVNITADFPLGIYFVNNVKLINCKIITPEGENKIVQTHAKVSIDGVEVK